MEKDLQRMKKIHKLINIISICFIVLSAIEVALLAFLIIYGSISSDTEIFKAYFEQYKVTAFSDLLVYLINDVTSGVAILLGSIFVHLYFKKASKTESLIDSELNKKLLLFGLLTIGASLVNELGISIIEEIFKIEFDLSTTSTVLFMIGLFMVYSFFKNKALLVKQTEGSDKVEEN